MDFQLGELFCGYRDILSSICKHLPYINIICLKRTNKFCYNLVGDTNYVESFHKILEKKFSELMDEKKAREFLAKIVFNGGYFSGSFIVQLILFDKWEPNEIDVYFNEKRCCCEKKWFKDELYFSYEHLNCGSVDPGSCGKIEGLGHLSSYKQTNFIAWEKEQAKREEKKKKLKGKNKKKSKKIVFDESSDSEYVSKNKIYYSDSIFNQGSAINFYGCKLPINWIVASNLNGNSAIKLISFFDLDFCKVSYNGELRIFNFDSLVKKQCEFNLENYIRNENSILGIHHNRRCNKRELLTAIEKTKKRIEKYRSRGFIVNESSGIIEEKKKLNECLNKIEKEHKIKLSKEKMEKLNEDLEKLKKKIEIEKRKLEQLEKEEKEENKTKKRRKK